MKRIIYILCVLSLSVLACGMQAQLPTAPSQLGSVSTETPVTTYPVKVLAVEPTEAAPIWITTGALNVRAEANADSEILGTLAPYTEIQIFIIDQLGDDCYGGEWYAISSPIEGFVCSLWVVKK